MGNGYVTDFWKDPWIGRRPLKDTFPGLFVVCNDSEITVNVAFQRGWQLQFRRWLTVDLLIMKDMLEGFVCSWVPNAVEDRAQWALCKNGKFTVRSMYNLPTDKGLHRPFKHLWKAKLPSKIKIWTWLIWHNAIATKST